jgi:hypothetical protein|tara:strand:+ start:311 stop:469 length:159 start_codon:yes stop_codon:yes gene_type:complete
LWQRIVSDNPISFFIGITIGHNKQKGSDECGMMNAETAGGDGDGLSARASAV